MYHLSPHFTMAEFTASQTAARRGINNTPPPHIIPALTRTAEGLEQIRARLGVPILVSSGYRCLELNGLLGSKPTSQHALGEAVDFTAPGFGNPRNVVDAIASADIDYDQLILEFAHHGGGWVHVSFADHPRHAAFQLDGAGARPLYA